MDNFLDKYARHLLVLFFILNFSYGIWMVTKGNLVFIFNFASGMYSLYVLAKWS